MAKAEPDVAALSAPLASAAIRPPPRPQDFAHVTTRYMVEARLRTRANLSQSLAALSAAVVQWSGRFQLTLWPWCGYKPKSGTREKPGTGETYESTVANYAAMLADNAHKTFPKGKAAGISLGTSRYFGRSDEECMFRSGLFLDSDDCGGWDDMRALLRSVGLAFVGQMRPLKAASHHLEIPLARPWVPVRDIDGSVKPWKDEVYRRQLGYLMGVFSELGGLRYEPRWDVAGHASAKHAGYDTACDQLLQLNYVYTRRPDDPVGHVPVTDHARGGGLDVEELLDGTGFVEAHAALTRPSRSPAPRMTVTGEATARRGTTPPAAPICRAIEPVARPTVVARLSRLRKPESRQLVAPLLAGISYATLGYRDLTMFRIASVLAAIWPHGDPVQLAAVFTDSLTTMSKEPGAKPAVNYVALKLSLAAKKIARAQRTLAQRGSDRNDKTKASGHR